MDRIGPGNPSDPDEVRAELLFVEPAGGTPTVHFSRPSEVDTERTTGLFSRVEVAIGYGRRLGRETSLDGEGFVFVPHETRVTDFYDDAEIRSIYYPEIEELIQGLTGAGHIVVFDHTVRGTIQGERGSVVVELPSDMMHCDFTLKAALETLQQVIPAEKIEAMQRGRIIQVNLWRPIAGPLVTMPLAVCDGSSIKPESCVETPLVRPDFASEFTTLAYDPEQRWSYLPGMTADEVIVLKNYDTNPAM